MFQKFDHNIPEIISKDAKNHQESLEGSRKVQNIPEDTKNLLKTSRAF